MMRNRIGRGASALLGRSKELSAAEAQRDAAQISAADKERQLKEMVNRGPGYRAVEQSAQERKAGVTAPGFEGLRDVKTGELLSQYKSDPYAGEALQKLKAQAFAEGASPWAQMQMQKQALEQSQAKDQAAQAQAQGIAQAQANLMRQGGLSSGARTRMAMMGAKDLARSQQDVARQGIQQRLGIEEQDINRKTDLLKKFGDAESAASEANIGRTTGDISRGTEFDMNRYKEQMAAYGAQQTAAAQRAAAGAGGKCFAEWTEVLMADLTTKKITEVFVGDELLAGGKVIEIRSYGDFEGFNLYDYKGVNLTGSHAVKELGEWKRVEDSSYAIKTDKIVDTVFTLVTENHIIIANGVLFSDDVETNHDFEDETESLKELNKTTY